MKLMVRDDALAPVAVQYFDAGNSCASGKSGCETRISSCNCQSNVGCPDCVACSGLRPTGTAATGACPGPCQCVEEEIWNSNVPPKPNCRWLNNFAELRRQWSDYGRQQAYKCRGCRRSCCCQCNNASRCCLCQPMPRGCNCPPPIQVDARAAHECSCDCPSSPECACPPSERRFPKTTAKCPNARLCCPSPRLPPTPKCYCPRCQPCPPPPCGPCTSAKCRRPLPLKDLCSPCPSCPPCRPVSTASPCRVTPTPCRNLTFCNERGGRPSSPCTGQSWRGITGDRSSESSIGSKQNGNEIRELHNRKDRDCCYADCIGSEIESKYTDKNRNLTLNEGYTHQNLESKTFINLSETTNPSKSVDPDSYVSEERDETAFENAAEALEECTIEKSSKDSWYTSPTPASSNSGTEPDYYAFQEEYPPTGRNVSGNLVLARLSSRIKSFSRLCNMLETDVDSTLCYHQRTNVTRGVVHPVGVSCTSEGTLSAYAHTNEKKSPLPGPPVQPFTVVTCYAREFAGNI
ncbi:Uncharacterized protein DBV15_10310 [Temnothorax longispinosus]|uniref:Uncharacterized protein n=1 Tax=Temnothorax longispinosus TaxID=300112 RepID=A0A4S2KPE1_9HYME|nr:Uncharacterized protein DBV15_10310 [Temnothorax longispinosus]